MDLKRLRYFCTIVEQGSISKAAQVLFIAQPPLSKRLQELEEEVGATLIVRTGRRFEPTEAGLYLYQRACEILRTVEDTRRKTLEIANTEKRVLRVGVSYLFQRYFFPVIRALYLRNPRAEISISVADTSHLEHLLQRGRIDIALCQRPANPDGFDLIDFPPVALHALVSTALMPEVPTAPMMLEEIGRHPLILMKRLDGTGTFEAILGQLLKAGIHPQVKMHVSDPSIAMEMLESGIDAVAFVPASEVIASRGGRFHAVEIARGPRLFMPCAARLSTNVDLPEVLDILAAFNRAPVR